MVEFPFIIGDSVRCCLDNDIPRPEKINGCTSGWYNAIVHNISKNIIPEHYDVSLKRDDNIPGGGVDGTWSILVKPKTLKYICGTEWDSEVNK